MVDATGDERTMGRFDTVRVLSFDCYGTLIDSGEGVLAALGGWRDRTQLDVADRELLDAFDRHEAAQEVVHPTALYPRILEETLAAMGDELGARPTAEEATAFGASVGSWPAFEDSAASLLRLSAQFKLIVVSNVDRASFAKSQEKLGLRFDAVITAEDVGAYKPAQPHFDALFATVERMGYARDQLLHVAQGLVYDHEPAQRLGFRAAWINRQMLRSAHTGTFHTLPMRTPEIEYPSMAAFTADAT